LNSKENCYLCGLESDYLPYRHKAERGISCKRCGDYYIDDLLVECKEPINIENGAILSGYTRWEKELGNSPPEINAQNIDQLIEDHKSFSTRDKVDKLLSYFSKINPNKGSFISFDTKLDYPITFLKNSDEFWYLLLEEAQKNLGYLKVEARDFAKIIPLGWERIELIKKFDLADKKFEIERRKVDSGIIYEESNLKERANLNGTRKSSGLARKIKGLYLATSLDKIEKKNETDKKIIFGKTILMDSNEINILAERIQRFVEKERAFVEEKIKNIYQECGSLSYYENDIKDVINKLEEKTKEIILGLQIEKDQRKRIIPELPEIDIDELLKMEEGTQLEFKSSFQWDVEQNCENKRLRDEAVKTVAAFNNTEGGYLLIGVDNKKTIFGLNKDYNLFKGDQKRDIFLQTFTQVIENRISIDFAAKIKVDFFIIEGKDICRIKVKFGEYPVWVRDKNKNEIFHIRIQNSSKSLIPSESVDYIKKKWPH